MHIYRGSIHLLDYIFYATVERGKMYETGAFIHNYALAYALQLVRSVPYTHQRQVPRYAEDLRPLNGVIYITPGAPQTFAHRLVQWNTIRDAYAFPGKLPSLGYPDWGFARVLRPDSRFVFYVLLADREEAARFPALRELLNAQPVRIRLGKFMGKARVDLEEATEVKRETAEFTTTTMLNWRDLTLDPIACDIVASSLPTRLIKNVSFPSHTNYKVSIGKEIVYLPADMQFLTRLPSQRRVK